jgi:hypothetical protein
MLELKSVAQVRTVEPTSTSWRYLRPSDGRKRELSCRSSADADFAAMERTGIEPVTSGLQILSRPRLCLS